MVLPHDGRIPPTLNFSGREPNLAPACVVLPFANNSLYLDRCAEPDKIQFGMDKEDNWPVPFWTVDTAMAIMLMLLAAVDEGLGAWYLGSAAASR